MFTSWYVHYYTRGPEPERPDSVYPMPCTVDQMDPPKRESEEGEANLRQWHTRRFCPPMRYWPPTQQALVKPLVVVVEFGITYVEMNEKAET